MRPPHDSVASAVLAIVVCGLWAAPVMAQTEARQAFTSALGGFSLGLRGAFGDDGPRLRANLDQMRRALDRWDEEIRGYEVAMTAERQTATPALAAQLHVALGAAYLDRGRAADARREFDAGVALEPTRADFRGFQTLARQSLGEPVTDTLRRAAALDPLNTVRAYQLGRHLLGHGETAEGTRELERFLSLASSAAVAPPGTAPMFPLAGLVQETPGLEPFFPPAAYADGYALLRTGDLPAALQRFEEALALDPLAAEPGAETGPLLRGGAALREGSIGSAIQSLQLAIELAPDRPEPHRILGQAYLLDEQHDRALTEIHTAVRLNPTDERTRLTLAAALIRSERLPAAADALAAALVAVPASGQARYELALVHQREGRYAEALALLEEALGFRPLIGANSVHQTIGALHRAQQAFDPAVAAFSSRLELIPNDARAHYELGRLYLTQGRHLEALAEFAVAVLLDPNDAESRAAAAQVHLREGRYADAVDASMRVLGLDADHREARYVLATSLIRLGRVEDGRRQLAIVEQQRAADAVARNRAFELGGLRREAAVIGAGGDHDKAIALLRKVVDADPLSPESLLDLGFALIDAGRHDDAIRYLEKSLALGAHYEAHRHLAEAYVVLGRYDDSRRERARYEQRKRDALRIGIGQ